MTVRHPGNMSAQMKRLLAILLLLLAEFDQTAACADRCSYESDTSWVMFCPCSGLGFSRVPQFLPTDVTRLDLTSNALTTVNPSDFARYYKLLKLDLRSNQISTIHSGAFYNLTSLTALHLASNRLTSIRADMFVGLGSLDYMDLRYNTIQNVESPTFNNTPKLNTLMFSNNRITNVPGDMFGLNMSVLQTLDLSFNRITAFPAEGLSLNTSAVSELQMEYNRIETLPLAAFDILASFSYVSIADNPWQCDCRMLPFRRRMTGFHTFEYTVICAGPPHLQDKGLLQEVNPEDLICGETDTATTASPAGDHTGTANTPEPGPVVVTAHADTVHTPMAPAPAPTTPGGTPSHFRPSRTEGSAGAASGGEFPVQVFLTGFLPGILLGALLASAAFVSIWCWYIRRKAGSVPDRSAVFSNISTTATVTAICQDQAGGHAVFIKDA